MAKGEAWNKNYFSWGGHSNRGTPGSSLVHTSLALMLGQ